MDNIELENVRPTLLLPPTEKGGIASEFAGGVFDLGDRVGCLTSTGEPLPLVIGAVAVLSPFGQVFLLTRVSEKLYCWHTWAPNKSSLPPTVSFV